MGKQKKIQSKLFIIYEEREYHKIQHYKPGLRYYRAQYNYYKIINNPIEYPKSNSNCFQFYIKLFNEILFNSYKKK